jgi:FAD/FMN-containing dehydrogenase
MPPLFQELAIDIEGEIVADQKTLSEYSTDHSPFYVTPQVVIYPKVTRDIEKIVSFGKVYHIPVTVRGSGCGTKGGALSPGIIVDMNRYFDKVGKLGINDSTLVVQAGAPYKDCLKRLSQWGYVLPFVDHTEDMTVGAMVATHYRSSTSLSSGGIGDWVESLRIILDDGKEYLVDSNVSPYGRLLEIYGGIFSCLKEENEVIFSGHLGVQHQGMGYDVFTSHISPKMLLQFILGSEGTLGIITEITLRLDTLPKHSEGVAISLNRVDDLPFIIDKVIPTYPVSFNGFDTKAFSLSKSASTLMRTRHSGDSLTLFAVYKGSRDSVERSIEKLLSTLTLPKENIHRIPQPEIELYEDIIFRQTKNLENYSSGEMRTVSLCNDLVFPTSSLHLAIKELQSLCEEYRVIYSTTLYAGSGVVRIETLFDTTTADAGDIISEMLTAVAKIVKWYRGAMSYSYGDGIITTPLLPLLFGADLATTLKKIKAVWDPNNVFNPGKKTTIDMTYLKKHLRQGSSE